MGAKFEITPEAIEAAARVLYESGFINEDVVAVDFEHVKDVTADMLKAASLVPESQ